MKSIANELWVAREQLRATARPYFTDSWPRHQVERHDRRFPGFCRSFLSENSIVEVSGGNFDATIPAQAFATAGRTGPVFHADARLRASGPRLV